MTLIVENGNLITKSGRLATDLGCCCGTPCGCVACRNGCSFYVSGEGYDSYDARCGAPSPPSGGSVLWTAPTAESSPGVLSTTYIYGDNDAYDEDIIGVGKLQGQDGFFEDLFGTEFGAPVVWGFRETGAGDATEEYYSWIAGFYITCVTFPNNPVVSLVLNSFLWDLFSTGRSFETVRRFSIVLQTATVFVCKDVSVNSESRYNECPISNPGGSQSTYCRIEIPFPLSVEVNGDGTTLNGTLHPWSTPIVPEADASVSFVVSKKDCCFNCESGAENICCNPLP
jgi:hypothetical protein